MKWLIFVVAAFLCWGSYGPTIHTGQKALGKPPASALQVFICVGMAYFLVAVVLPLIVMQVKGMEFSFNKQGVTWGTLAGVLGALGAFFVILAFMNGGTPRYVMPLVFAGAPIVNVIVTMITEPPQGDVNPLMYVGFVMAAAGAGMVLYFKPH